uniref:Uncharacterized LOC100175991 n=1 Tax=Ciona intestinalis TaxID=7719 RepID=F6V526_CIOIN|nr:uncharacterized protein LOC100175991 [Ciona intestinalis]|eukprot:XP_002131393.1 uncharacterized protein LOC100175991 [Ciona intestinalis]
MSGCLLRVLSQNVSCDTHSVKLTSSLGDEFSFENRIKVTIDNLAKLKADVIALNEIRIKEKVEFTKQLLENKGFSVFLFWNNENDMSFRNIIAISKQSKWNQTKWEHKWVSVNEQNQPCLSNVFSTIQGDQHGRCVGIVYLQHKDTKKQVCVAVSHVVPFGEVKYLQQKALMSLNIDNHKLDPPVSTIIAGDLNRFDEDKEIFQQQIKNFKLQELQFSKLVIKHSQNNLIRTNKDVGTFNPWPVDKMLYEDKSYMAQPMSYSKLDLQVCSNDMTIKQAEVHASMLKPPNLTEPSPGVNEVRHILDKVMSSDHLAVLGEYEI